MRMGKPVGVEGDLVVAVDQHEVLTAAGPPTILPHQFSGRLDGDLSPTVRAGGRAVATVGSRATNTPPHVPALGASFVRPPGNSATVIEGSATVFVGGRPVARAGDRATTCNDPVDLPVGAVEAVSTVQVG
jgi:uncharacterized Zn-binding protein involved in type VI secretion